MSYVLSYYTLVKGVKNVLMSISNCEKDSLLGHKVLVKRPLSNFERGHFYLYTLYYKLITNQ